MTVMASRTGRAICGEVVLGLWPGRLFLSGLDIPHLRPLVGPAVKSQDRRSPSSRSTLLEMILLNASRLPALCGMLCEGCGCRKGADWVVCLGFGCQETAALQSIDDISPLGLCAAACGGVQCGRFGTTLTHITRHGTSTLLFASTNSHCQQSMLRGKEELEGERSHAACFQLTCARAECKLTFLFLIEHCTQVISPCRGVAYERRRLSGIAQAVLWQRDASGDDTEGGGWQRKWP